MRDIRRKRRGKKRNGMDSTGVLAIKIAALIGVVLSQQPPVIIKWLSCLLTEFINV
jgi:hypothetical protein